MLENINSDKDLKKLNKEEKEELADDIRKYILEIVIKKWRTFSFKFRSGRANNCTS